MTFRERKFRLAHSRRRIAEQERVAERLERQEKHVRELSKFANDQLAGNGLAELFLSAVRGQTTRGT